MGTTDWDVDGESHGRSWSRNQSSCCFGVFLLFHAAKPVHISPGVFIHLSYLLSVDGQRLFHPLDSFCCHLYFRFSLCWVSFDVFLYSSSLLWVRNKHAELTPFLNSAEMLTVKRLQYGWVMQYRFSWMDFEIMNSSFNYLSQWLKSFYCYSNSSRIDYAI